MNNQHSTWFHRQC